MDPSTKVPQSLFDLLQITKVKLMHFRKDHILNSEQDAFVDDEIADIDSHLHSLKKIGTLVKKVRFE